MQFVKKLYARSIKFKIMSSLITVIILLVVLSIINQVVYSYNISKYKALLDNLTYENSIAISSIEILPVIREFVSNPNNKENQKAYDTYKEQTLDIEKIILKNASEGAKSKAESLINTINSFLKKSEEVLVDAQKGDVTATDKYNSAATLVDFIKENSGELVRSELEYSQIMRKKIDQVYSVMNFIMIVLSVIIIAVGITVTLLIVRKIVKSLNKVVKLSGRISTGHLAVERLEITGEDEISILYKAFNTMQEGLVETVRLISGNANKMHTNVLTLNNIISDSYSRNQELANSVETTASSSEEQTGLIESTIASISDINESIRSIYEETQVVSNTSRLALEKATSGQGKMIDAIEHTEAVYMLLKDLSTNTQELYNYSQKIGKITRIINDISENTNLLSLNAAIEAARAGEAGRGFAVVADEVKKLADQSKLSSTEISLIVKNIQNHIDKMQIGMKKSLDGITLSNVILRDEGMVAFREITDANKIVDGQITSINKRVDLVKDNLSEINGANESIGEITSSLVQSAAQALSDIQQQLATYKDVNDSTLYLKALSEEFDKYVNKFKIDE